MSLLEVNDLHKAYGAFRAVQGVSFSLEKGEMLALIGPNGAGKSTTFNMVGGQTTANAGSVLLNGKPVLGMKGRDIWKRGVGRTFQIAATFASLTVAENVQMTLLSYHQRIFSFVKAADTQYRPEALALLEQVGMAEQADRPCSELAYGDVKRVELAMALANDPVLLLMDEPTAGMAPQERNELMALTRQLAQQRQMGVLFTEHSMDVVFNYADRILVLAAGWLIAEGTPEQIRNDPKVKEIYLGSGLGLETLKEGVPS
ncbi:MAG: ABC transporter ATP-binding protein [Alcaligenaceae bacterium]|nr:ABC transporter ATP-binding protein [Alcaligenaceae bacterium]